MSCRWLSGSVAAGSLFFYNSKENLMGFIKKFFANTRKPQGFLGKLMVDGMNKGHAKCADWGMENIKDISPKTILDCGCGGGRNIKALLEKFPDAVAWGLDYSEISVEKTRQVNKAAIDGGRCNVVQGDVSALPFDENSFELVTGFETVYFWPDIESRFKQVFRVLKPGGLFLIVNETDGEDAMGEKWEKMIDGMKLYKGAQLIRLLKNAGFANVDMNCKADKHWLSVWGHRP